MDTQEPDPSERLRLIAESTRGAKEEHNALGARLMTDWGEYAAPRTFHLASRLYSQIGMANMHRPIHNLVISNVPGPSFPLYFAGAKLIAAYPMGPIMEGAGINVTVLSYEDNIDVGFMVDRELTPDVWDLAAAVEAAYDELLAAARAKTGTAVPAEDATAEKAPEKTSTDGPATATTTASRKATAKKAPANKATKKAAAKKATGNKTPTRKSATKKAPAKKATMRKMAAKKAPARKTASSKKAAPRKPSNTRVTERGATVRTARKKPASP